LQTHSDFKLIIIDDGSIDGTKKTVLDLNQPWIDIIAGDGTLWWTGAINLGVRYVQHIANNHDWVMTINNDVLIDRYFLENMYNEAIRHDRAILNPIAVAGPNGVVHFSGTKVISWALALKRQPSYGRPIQEACQRGLISVDYLNGRGTMMPVKVFEEIGLYNQRLLPHYGADEEFTWRAKANGYKLFINTRAVVEVDSKTTGFNPLDVRMSLSEIIRSFSSMKSTNNLLKTYRQAKLCAPFYALPSYLTISLLKLLFYNFVVNRFIKRS